MPLPNDGPQGPGLTLCAPAGDSNTPNPEKIAADVLEPIQARIEENANAAGIARSGTVRNSKLRAIHPDKTLIRQAEVNLPRPRAIEEMMLHHLNSLLNHLNNRQAYAEIMSQAIMVMLVWASCAKRKARALRQLENSYPTIEKIGGDERWSAGKRFALMLYIVMYLVIHAVGAYFTSAYMVDVNPNLDGDWKTPVMAGVSLWVISSGLAAPFFLRNFLQPRTKNILVLVYLFIGVPCLALGFMQLVMVSAAPSYDAMNPDDYTGEVAGWIVIMTNAGFIARIVGEVIFGAFFAVKIKETKDSAGHRTIIKDPAYEQAQREVKAADREFTRIDAKRRALLANFKTLNTLAENIGSEVLTVMGVSDPDERSRNAPRRFISPKFQEAGARLANV